MAYEVLAQKWRPKKFSEVIGQQHILTTLQNQILNERVGHAYLFWGPRGTGKTSVARLFAKTVNCPNLWDSEPCNNCAVCKEIAQDRCIDVLEIDAASNRGIDPIRELKENVKLAPTRCTYKIYIIDEVHMLTKEAFNALLKTLEEPPSNVIFILATTEYSKIPKTITSRCQDFEFHYLDLDRVVTKLDSIAIKEEIKVPKEVLVLLAKQSDGCLRDAENLLERLGSSVGKEISLEQAEKMLGLSSANVIKRFAISILEMDLQQNLYFAMHLTRQGNNLIQCVHELIDYFRKLRLVTRGSLIIELMDITASEVDEFKSQIEEVPLAKDFNALSRIIKILIKTTYEMKQYGYAQVQLESALIQIHSVKSNIDMSKVLGKLELLEQKMDVLEQKGIVVSPPKQPIVEPQITKSQPKKVRKENSLFEGANVTLPDKLEENNFEPDTQPKREIVESKDIATTKPEEDKSMLILQQQKEQKKNKPILQQQKNAKQFKPTSLVESFTLRQIIEFKNKKAEVLKNERITNVLDMFNAEIVEIK